MITSMKEVLRVQHGSSVAPCVRRPYVAVGGDRHSRAAKRARAAASAQADGDALRLQDWLESRPPMSAPKISAEQRRAALLQRIAAKQ